MDIALEAGEYLEVRVDTVADISVGTSGHFAD